MDNIINLKEEIDKKIMEDTELQVLNDLIKESELLDTLEFSTLELQKIGMDKITLDTDFVLNLIQQNQEYIDSLIEEYFNSQE